MSEIMNGALMKVKNRLTCMWEDARYTSLAQMPAHNLKRPFITNCFSVAMWWLFSSHTLKETINLTSSAQENTDNPSLGLPATAALHNCLGNPVGMRHLRAISSSQIPVCVLPCRCLRCSEMSWMQWRWCLVGCCRRPGCLRLHLPPWANTKYNNYNFIPCAHIILKDRDRYQHDDRRVMSAMPIASTCEEGSLLFHILRSLDQRCSSTDFHYQNLME